MTFTSLKVSQPSFAWKDRVEANDIRALVAKYLGVDVRRVTDETHFRDDLRVDWLGRLELLILIEDQFAGVEFRDGDADQIETVGDLIRYIEDARLGSMTGAPCPSALS